MIDSGFWAAFGAVFVAELGDKTQLGVLLATDRLRRPWPIFFGASAALLATTLLATTLGAALGEALPVAWLRLAGGLLFVGLGLVALIGLRHAPEGDDELPLGRGARGVLLMIFAAIFFAEMGDKTQLVTATLASGGDPISVAAGAGLALVTSCALAVSLGRAIARLPARARLGLRATGALLFVGFGLWYLYEASRGL